MSKTEIIYRDIAPGADENAKVTSSSADSHSNLASLPFEGETFFPAILEQNIWLLNGKAVTVTNQRPAYWSDRLSDDEGWFDNPPSVTISFTERFSSLGLTLTFDEVLQEWCSVINIKWYQGGTILEDVDFYPDGPSFFCVQAVVAYDKIVITFKRTSLPNRRARMSAIIFGSFRRFGMKDMRSATLTNEMSPISSEVPISTFNLSLDSNDELGYMFQLKQPLEVYNDNKQLGTYYIEEHTRLSRNLYNLTCHDAFGVLDESPYTGGVFNNKSARTLFNEIVDGDYKVIYSIADTNLTGIIEPCTRREALQQVLFAWGAAAATDGGSEIKVFSLDNTPEDIDPNHIYIGASVDTSAIVTKVEVTAHTYKADSNGAITIGNTKYSDTETVYTVTNPLATANDKQRVIKATGTLISPAIGQKTAQRVYDYYQRRNVAKAKIVWKGELLGNCITLPLQWGGTTTGNIKKMEFTISNTVAAQLEVAAQ